jgi:FkbM family methyltransferase
MMRVYAFTILCVELIRCNIVIRPSDHLLSGTDYHRYSPRKSDHPHPLEPSLATGLIHPIRRPGDVPIDADFTADFWGVVDFAPVPQFSIDTHSVLSGKGPWDKHVWDKLVSLLTASGPGHAPLFVDVGANLGYFSLAAASLGAHVIAFEPLSRNALKFSKSIAQNRFEDRISLFQNVVREDGASVHVALRDSGHSHATHSGQGIYGVDFASTTSLSYIVREDVDVLKIDAAGSESAVISGAKRLICNFRVKHIIIVNFSESGSSTVEMLKFLDSAGYNLSKMHTPHVIFTLKGERADCKF